MSKLITSVAVLVVCGACFVAGRLVHGAIEPRVRVCVGDVDGLPGGDGVTDYALGFFQADFLPFVQSRGDLGPDLVQFLVHQKHGGTVRAENPDRLLDDGVQELLEIVLGVENVPDANQACQNARPFGKFFNNGGFDRHGVGPVPSLRSALPA